MKAATDFIKPIVRAGVLFVLTALPALAQEAAPSPADSPTGTIFRWINFAIIFGLIVWAFSKAGPGFRKNAEQISERIAEGTRAREAAEKQKQEAQAKIAGIPTEVAALRVEAKRGAEAEAERIKQAAKVEAEMIERAAQAEIAAAEREARIELKALAAQMATARAEALLRQQMNPQAEATLFGSFVAQLERSPN